MSKKRHEPKTDSRELIAVRSLAVRFPRGHAIAPHAHPWHQLIYATSGVMQVRTDPLEWIVPPHRAVWVPGGIEHSIAMNGDVFVRTLYVHPRLRAPLPNHCCAVDVSPLLREVIVHICSIGALDVRIPERKRLSGFLLDLLRSLPTAGLQLPWPGDARALTATRWIVAHLSEPASIVQVARRAGCSPRTLERLFVRETGMTFARWRVQVRLVEALKRLAAGQSVTAVSMEVGYESPSAFITVFRRYLGVTPSRYFDVVSTTRP